MEFFFSERGFSSKIIFGSIYFCFNIFVFRKSKFRHGRKETVVCLRKGNVSQLCVNRFLNFPKNMPVFAHLPKNMKIESYSYL